MRLVLDACVLFPGRLRDILLGVAERGGFTPLWSARILRGMGAGDTPTA